MATFVIKFVEYLGRKPRWLVLTAGIALIGLLGAIDHVTGDYSLTLFYLMPVFLGAWFVNKWAGLALGLLSGLAIVLAQQLPYPRSYDPFVLHIWNTSMEVLFLLIMSHLISILKNDLEAEKALARLDPLTSAVNRRSFQELADYEINQSLRHKRVLSVAYLDLDNFKTVNDSMGHQVGDDLLVKVVQTLKQNMRITDVVARLGGDEFCILFPETCSDDLHKVLENLQHCLLATMSAHAWPVTFSIGAITYNSPPASADAMLSEADARMYAAKRAGKNMISHSTVELHPP